MANKVIRHWSDSAVVSSDPPEANKNKSIAELTRKELWDMLSRLRDETEIQRLIRELKRSSGERDTFEKPFEIDTQTPIKQLYHYGIPGMKWGLRRFQKSDGTRTVAGKKRENEDRRHGKSEDHMTSRTAKKRGPEGLSNDQLRKLNERLQLEDNFKKLSAAKMEKSESWVRKSLESAGQQALTEFTKGLFLGGAKLMVKELSPQFAEIAFGIKPAPEKKK